MARILKNDIVKVIAGKDKGKEGKVLAVLFKNNRVLVQGVNMVFRHLRKSQDHPQGARIRKEAPIHISNVMLKDPKTGDRTRISYLVPAGQPGKTSRIKQRVAKKSGSPIEKSLK
ncbi:50S ribosomal protein L24 [Planctomycetota bacterium]